MKSSEYIKPSAEEIAKIKQEDRETINKFYLLNYNFIQTIAKAYCISRNIPLYTNSWQDMVNDIYLSFYKLKFERNSDFVRSCKDICCYSRVLGEKTFHQIRQGDIEILTILDEPLIDSKYRQDTGETLKDIIPSDFDLFSYIETETDKSEQLCEFLCKFLSAREKECFELCFHSDITSREVAKIMGITQGGVFGIKGSFKRKLKKHKKEIIDFLYLNNIHKFDYIFKGGNENGNETL